MSSYVIIIIIIMFIWKHKQYKKTVEICDQYKQCVPRVRKAETALTTALKDSNTVT